MWKKGHAICGMIISGLLFVGAITTVIICKYIGYWWDAFFMRSLVSVCFLAPMVFALCLFAYLVTKKRESKAEEMEKDKN